jgi:uncharacterized protein
MPAGAGRQAATFRIYAIRRSWRIMLLPIDAELLLAFCMFLGAILYTSVGHGGASAYIALMALFSVPALVMRPTALVLNILVTSFSSIRFARAGLFRWRTVWPLLIGAIPAAYLGGGIQLPSHVYKTLVGVVLLIAAVRLLWPKELKSNTEWSDPPIPVAIAAGAAIGFLSGLTGTGGGIFLSPLLLFMAWSETRAASGVTAVFILCNSAAGLLGNYASVQQLPADLPLFAGAVMLGALIGTTLGISKLAQQGILKALGLVLIIAGLKLIGVY